MKQQHKTETEYNYKGSMIHASEGLHEVAIGILNAEHPSGGKHVLDLGCGSGAFTKRLCDNNFSTTSVDILLDSFNLNTVALEIDLNSNFSETLSVKHYDAIVALELIEHLENPLGFLRQLKSLTSDDTILIISFPNIYLHYAIKSFIYNGTFVNWNIHQYWHTGHQTIMTDWLFEQHLKKVGLAVSDKLFCAPVEFPSVWYKKIYNKLFFLLVKVISPSISKQARLSDVVLYKIMLEKSH